MMKVIFSRRRRKFPPPKRSLFNKFVRKTAKLCGIVGHGENRTLAVNFVGPATIADINENFVGRTGTTDVISFDYSRGKNGFADEPDAEIFICSDVAWEKGRKIKKSSFADEIALYLIHGILHISGEDDSSPAERKKMFRKQSKIFAEMKRTFNFKDVFPEKYRLE